MDPLPFLTTVLLLTGIAIQGAYGSFIKVKYFGGFESGCVEHVKHFAVSKGYEVRVADFTNLGKVCFPGNTVLHPKLHNGDIAFVKNNGKQSYYKLHTGVTTNTQVTVMHDKKENEWIMSLGDKFQIIVRDCALMVIYKSETSHPHHKSTLGLAPHGTFTLPNLKLPCCGSSCLDHTCKYEKGYSKGLKPVFFPKPDYGCNKHETHALHLPPPPFFKNVQYKDKKASSHCQTDLNICVVGEKWAGSPKDPWYNSGCFATFLQGEVRLPSAPSTGCSSHGHQRKYKICIEHDDFVRISIGDRVFEYLGDYGPTKDLTPHKSCRYFTVQDGSYGDLWLPIQVWYSGTGLSRYSHLSVSILPLKKCVVEHYKETKLFCDICTGEADRDCCKPLGPCDLRYHGECSPTKKDLPDFYVPKVTKLTEKTYGTSLPKTKITHAPSQASCLVGGDDACATAVAGRGFSDGRRYSLDRRDEIDMCCRSFLKQKHRGIYSWRPSPVEWRATTVEYEPAVQPWVALGKSHGTVFFDDYRKPICDESIQLTYLSDGLPPGDYVAKVHITSRDKHSGEWDDENDDILEIHLLVLEAPKVDFKAFKLDENKDGVDFTASIDTLQKKLSIDADYIQLKTGDGYHEQSGVIKEILPRHDKLIVKGWLPIKDPFDCQENPLSISAVGQLTTKHYDECGTIHFVDDTEFCHPPTCRFYATDASYRGGDGLVTDKYSADFIVMCTQEPKICKDCITLDGPYKWDVVHFAKLKDSPSSFFLKVVWDPKYLGPIHVGIADSSHYNSGCSLELEKHYACGGIHYKKIANVEGVVMNRVEEVAVHSLSYKIHNGCDGGENCSESQEQEWNPWKSVSRKKAPRLPTIHNHDNGISLPTLSNTYKGSQQETYSDGYEYPPSQEHAKKHHNTAHDLEHHNLAALHDILDDAISFGPHHSLLKTLDAANYGN